jgi:thiol-disulfide isomerase/thioredoxin
MSVEKTNDSEYKDLLESNEKVAIKFYADWCGSCKLIAPKFRRLSDNEANDSITFLDVNAEENPEIRKWAGVNNLPFFAMVNKGEIIAADFTSKIDNVENMIGNLRDA